MSQGLVIERRMDFTTPKKGRRRPAPATPAPSRGRVPRVARLLALAHRIEDLVRRGEVRGYAAVARLGGVTRARVAQIASLANLAPDIQEAILGMSSVTGGKDPLSEHDLRPIAAEMNWSRQRRMWRDLLRTSGATSS